MHRVSSYAGCLAAAAVLLAGTAGAGAQDEEQAPSRDPGTREATRRVRIYRGVSSRGLLQEALDDAVRQALRAMPGADRMVRYRVRDILGEQGGIRGANIVRVVIEVTGDDEPFYLEGKPVPPAPEERPRVEPPPAPVFSDAEVIRQSVKPVLRLSKNRVNRGGAVDLEFTVQNTSNQTVRIPFAGGRGYDFDVWRDNRLVWRWSQARRIVEATGTLTLVPGEVVTYRQRWDQRNNRGMYVPAGKYLVRGYVPTSSDDGASVQSTVPLTITGR